jgi:signal transduction histidine kinase
VLDVTEPPEPLAPRWPRPGDLPAWVAAVVVLAFQVGGSLGADNNSAAHEAHRPLDLLGYILLSAGPVLLIGRRRFPGPVLAGIAACTVTYYLYRYVWGPAFTALAVALGAAVTAGHRRAAWITGIASVAANCGLSWLFSGSGPIAEKRPTLSGVLGQLAFAVIVLVASEVVRGRTEKAAEGRRARAEEQRRKASEERLRIARELHDVLAHNISMINVQAGVALHLMDQPGEDREAGTRAALTAIKAASKEALTEMRSVIGVLRQQGEEAPRAPTAGLDRLPELTAQAETAGLRVRVDTEGTARPLPAQVDLAAFRIVQESVTNVTRHAGASRFAPVTVRILLGYRPEAVSVQVDDDGRGDPAAPDGHGGSGIAGMRERAHALGGEFTAGPRPGGGFRVRALLPVEGE